MLRAAAACLGLVAITASASPTPAPVAFAPPEYRALWVDALHDGIKSPAQVEKLVSDARSANLNALFVQVRLAGDAYFNRADEPRAKDIRGPAGFDPLAYVVRLAHASVPRIEVDAWVNTFFVGSSSQVYLQHGAQWGNRASDGSVAGYLDPGVPEVQIYTHRVLMDLVRNYAVDGLHLDFIRYPGSDWGYSPWSTALYMLQSGSSNIPAADDPAWQEWRRQRVTAFVRDLHEDLQLQKPGVKLSAALICYGAGPLVSVGWTDTAAYSSVYQDWRDWLLKGYLDIGVPMNYDSDWSGREKVWFGQWLAFEKDSSFAGRVITGVGAFLNYPENTLAQIRRVLAPSAHGNHVLGVAIYSYASTSVYGTDDFYTSTDLSGSLPRQPYADGIASVAGLAARAKTFNASFITELAHPFTYHDVELGWIDTQPVFTEPALVPAPQAAGA
ncbi:MAG TPA: family 10 glycosylhydrolase [Candidatus Dormibacteraeota bacterium]